MSPVPTICTAVGQVKCTVVKVAHLPPGLRFDYLLSSYGTIVGQEWVCPDGPGLIGELGRQWWMERASRVPGSIDEAYNLAQRLPRPKEISVKAGSGCIESFHYPGAIGVIDGATSLFYADIDQEAEREYARELKREKKDRKAGRLFGASSSPEGYHGFIPAWWRLEQPPKTIQSSLSNPLDRNSISERQKQSVRTALNASRHQWAEPDLAVSGSNLCMAYTLTEPPTAEELFAFLCYDGNRSQDALVRKHKALFVQKLRAFESREWLDGIIEPRLTYLRSFPKENQEHVGFHLGIGTAGCVQPASLAWNGEYYEYDTCKWIPCVDISGVFSLDEFKLCKAIGSELPSFLGKIRTSVTAHPHFMRL